MKIRSGFISNSSSCSFVIYKKNVNDFQKYIIRNWAEIIRGLYYNNIKIITADEVEDVSNYEMEEKKEYFEFIGYDDVLLDDIFRNLGIQSELSGRYEDYDEYH